MAIKKLSVKRSRRSDRRRSIRLATSRGGPSAAGPGTVHAKPGGGRRVGRRVAQEKALSQRRRERPVHEETGSW